MQHHHCLHTAVSSRLRFQHENHKIVTSIILLQPACNCTGRRANVACYQSSTFDLLMKVEAFHS
jgi:hypothetical protein